LWDGSAKNAARVGKGQEILPSEKVAIHVSIVVQFRVTDPAAALQNVAEYGDRLCSDVQLAARRSLASMTLEDILTNRTPLSEDILAEVLAVAAGYGVAILRADVKDLIFPGNLQDIMNRVLATERLSIASGWSVRIETSAGAGSVSCPTRRRQARHSTQSLSSMVTSAVATPSVAPLGLLSVTKKSSGLSLTVSPTMSTVIWVLTNPASIVTR
jgi:regulator of protease activity HflC (stomatin/prohibitin superfamily)